MQKNAPDPYRIKQITDKIIGLPTLPTVVSKMIELVDNPKTSAASLANLISTDQALTARILKMANSAYYGFSREIYTVNMAIVVMGFNAVKEMGLSLSVFDVFKDLSAVRHFDIAQYWQHTIGCGVASKMMARRYRYSIAGEAFVAGLLHDIGKIVINQYMHDDFFTIMNRVADNRENLDDVEMEILGTRHGEIGAWLADRWRLPVIISESIRYHHTPWEAKKNPVLVSIVNVANYLCHATGIGNSGRPIPLEIDERTWTIFNENKLSIDFDDVENLQTEFLLEFDKTETLTTFLYKETE